MIQYTGNCSINNDGSGNYRIKFLNSGTLTLAASLSFDVFVVGGGGGNAGGGGYTKTYSNLSVAAGTYSVVVGSGGASGVAGTANTGGGGGAGNVWNNACTDGYTWYGFGHYASPGGSGTVIIRKAQ